MITLHLTPVIGQIFLLIMGCFALLVSAFSRITQSKHVYYVVQFSLLAAAVLFWRYGVSGPMWLPDHVFSDHLAMVANVFVCLFTFVALIYSRGFLLAHRFHINEYCTLVLFAVLGMTVMCIANNLLLLYLGIELLSLSSYVLVAMRRDNAWAIEAAVKYFVMGAIASGMLLYGMSLLFGAARSLDIVQIAHTVAMHGLHHYALLLAAMIFLAIGITFKLGVAPFHMWVPDVYQGAPAPVTLFIASAPKLATFVLLIRIFPMALPTLHVAWSHLFMVLAVLSMLIGNIAALRQTEIKRLLAYSSIAHMGYVMCALACATPAGYASGLFYMITYTLMTLLSFGVLALLLLNGKEVIEIQTLQGLNQRHPWLAFLMLLNLFSMAGIPPLVGFMGKLGILQALIQAHLVWLAVVLIIFAIIGIYYYLRIVKVMYFETEEPTVTLTFEKSPLRSISEPLT